MLRNGLEPWHVIILLAVILLVFGGKKLPELARGSGRALRIFKAETKGVFTEEEEVPAKGSASNNVGQLDSGASASAAEPVTPATPAKAPQPDAVRHDAGTD